MLSKHVMFSYENFYFSNREKHFSGTLVSVCLEYLKSETSNPWPGDCILPSVDFKI